MKLWLLSMTLMAAALGTAWAQIGLPLMYCLTTECGHASGWGEKSKQSWPLQFGPNTNEVVPSASCLVGGVKGFKATVCLSSSYPTMQCAGLDHLYVQKNGSPIGSIEVIPYCGLFRRSNE